MGWRRGRGRKQEKEEEAEDGRRRKQEEKEEAEKEKRQGEAGGGQGLTCAWSIDTLAGQKEKAPYRVHMKTTVHCQCTTTHYHQHTQHTWSCHQTYWLLSLSHCHTITARCITTFWRHCTDKRRLRSVTHLESSLHELTAVKNGVQIFLLRTDIMSTPPYLAGFHLRR